MNSQRRADLQRKLSMGGVPRPPDGLLERIKADIPQHLHTAPQPARFSWSLAMRVAASLILLITTAVVTHRVMQPAHKSVSRGYEPRLVPAVMPIPQQRAAESSTAPRAEEEVRLQIDETVELPAASAPARVDAPATPERTAEMRDAIAGGVTGNVASAAPATPSAPSEQFASADAARALPAAAPPPPPPPAAAPHPAVQEMSARSAKVEQITVTAHAPAIASESQAASLMQRKKAEVFGISVDPGAFGRISDALASGARPEPDRVDVEAVVNYFAGSRPPRSGLKLEVEASPAPIAAEGNRAVLRFTVDTARNEDDPASPVATEVHVDVDANPRVVRSMDRVGGSNDVPSERALLRDTSVTALYDLDLIPSLRSADRVATVELTYRSVPDGRQHTVTRTIHANDLGTWSASSRRHKLATLGAMWGETLRSAAPDGEIARRAKELAEQKPDDSKARELAKAASATADGM